MAAPYSGTSVSGYNANPPPDDGTTVSTNLITWNSTIKSKIGDPLNTFATNVDANITTAFGKTLDGATVVSTAVNYAAGAADQGRLIKATASGITITTPDAGTVNAPFCFEVNNQSTGTITLAGNATNSQTIDGSTSQVIQPGSGAKIKTDGTNWFTTGLKAAQISTTGSNYGFTDPVNLQLSASVATNILTVAVKTKAGNDPSAGDPVILPFRDTTKANGDPVWVTISAALSINTNATGATLASQNGTPFRFWIVAFNNAGTAVLALWHSGAGASTPVINPLNETTLQSTTGISAAATSAGVFYTPNGTTLTSKAFRILGYLEYTTGLVTAGTYSAAPDIMQLFGPGIKKPGDVVQKQYATASSQTSVSSTTKTQTNTSVSITPSSSVNLMAVRATGAIGSSSGASEAAAQLSRGAAPTLIGNLSGNGSSSVLTPCTLEVLDAPNTTSATTYYVYVWNTSTNTTKWIGTQGSIGLATTSTIVAEEIMA